MAGICSYIPIYSRIDGQPAHNNTGYACNKCGYRLSEMYFEVDRPHRPYFTHCPKCKRKVVQAWIF